MSSNNDFKQLVTPTLVRNVFESSVLDDNNRGWCILVAGRVITINGRMLYPTREQAVKAFYNRFNWRVTSAMHNANSRGTSSWWRDRNRSDYWKSFKKVLEEEYSFKIVKV